VERFHIDTPLHFSVDVPDEMQDLACIHIILQPFVENSILHGQQHSIPILDYSIQITAKQEEDDILFSITDNGIGMTQEQIQKIFTENTLFFSGGYGVKNIHSRIQLSYGEKYGVTYTSQPGRGTTAWIRIPVMTSEDAENNKNNSQFKKK